MASQEPNEQFARIERLFDETLLQPDEERDGWLIAECGADTVLLENVRSLLRAYRQERDFSQSLLSEKLEAAPKGRRLGPYQTLSLLGRGGMGAVYLAERADGQYEKKVAIKVIDLPLATEVFFERFRQERQILAGLDHPDIARMLDGGVSDEGILYLVMEYVEGEPLDVYCRTHSPSLETRLQLFMRICRAVQFAHQNLVIHRDLKPDNILISADEAPHLLDFGTAKFLAADKSADTLGLTRQGFLSFTPAYASPEQVLGKPITTASDTYSLGVLLYLLLTGRAPYQLSEYTTEEMVEIICQRPPQPPSSPDHVFPDTDLEAILSKALRKEPEARYQTAEQLASDVEAYLEHKPVSARKGTLRYTAQKFIRRNRLAISFAAVLLLTAAAGVAGIIWQAHAARRAELRAEARSADLLQLTDGLLSELDSAIQQLPGSTGAQQLLVSRVLKSLDPLAAQAQHDKATAISLANAYTRLGSLQGDPYEQNIGDKAGAVHSINKALEVLQPAVDSHPNDFAVLSTLAYVQNTRGEILSMADDNEGSAASLRASIATFQRLLSFPNPKPKLFLQAASVYDTLGDVMGQDVGFSDLSAAMENYKKAIELDQRALKVDPNYAIVQRGLILMQMKIGNVDLDLDPAQAFTEFHAALDRLQARTPAEQALLTNLRLRGLLLRKQGMALAELGRYREAQQYFQRSEGVYGPIMKADPKDERAVRDIVRLLENELNCAEYAIDPLLAEPGSSQRAAWELVEALAKRKIDVTRQLIALQPNDPDIQNEFALTQVYLAAAQRKLGNTLSSDTQAASAWELLKKSANDPKASPRVLELALDAFFATASHSPQEAQLALQWAHRGSELTHRKLAIWQLLLAEADSDAGNADQARRDAQDGLALLSPSVTNLKEARTYKLLAKLSR